MVFPYDTSHPAVVLSLFDTGLITARCLAADGIRVTGLGYRAEEVGRGSRIIKTAQCHHPIDEPEALLKDLLDLAATFSKKPVLYPATDLFMKFVDEYRDALAERYLFVIPSRETVRMLTNKRPQYDACQTFGIPQAPAFFPKPGDDIAALAREMRFPLFIKPVSNHPWQNHYSVKGFVCETHEELHSRLEGILKRNLEVMVQEIVPGEPNSNIEVSFYIDRGGRRRGHIAVRKIRQYPMGFGLATRIETISDPVVEALAFDAAEKFGILGLANMEFKYDARDGKPKYIETNIRVWQQIDLGAASDVPFTALYHADATGQSLPDPLTPKLGKTWVDPVLDFYALAAQQTVSIPKFFSWMRSTARADVTGVLSFGDPVPTMKKLGKGLEPFRMLKFAWKNRK